MTMNTATKVIVATGIVVAGVVAVASYRDNNSCIAVADSAYNDRFNGYGAQDPGAAIKGWDVAVHALALARCNAAAVKAAFITIANLSLAAGIGLYSYCTSSANNQPLPRQRNQ